MRFDLTYFIKRASIFFCLISIIGCSETVSETDLSFDINIEAPYNLQSGSYLPLVHIVSKNDSTVKVNSIVVNRGNNCDLLSHPSTLTKTLEFGQKITAQYRSNCNVSDFVEITINTDSGSVTYY